MRSAEGKEEVLQGEFFVLGVWLLRFYFSSSGVGVGVNGAVERRDAECSTWVL